MPADFTIKRGDRRPPITATITDSTRNPVDLTGATVAFVMRDVTTGTIKVNSAGTIVGSPTAGNVSYSWGSTDTNTSGTFLGEWKVTFADTTVETFPNQKQLLIDVSEDALTESLGTASASYASVGQLRVFGINAAQATDTAASDVLETASRWVDNYTGAQFYQTTTTVTVSDVRNPIVRLPRPFTNITAVTINNRTLDPTGYTTESWGLRLYIPGFLDIDGFPRRTLTQVGYGYRGYGSPYGSQVQVTATFGYPSVPSPVKRATLLVASAFIVEQSDQESLLLQNVGARPERLDITWKAEAKRYLDEAKELLAPYRNTSELVG